MIFFSVIIPTYNRAHLVGETIESVLAQNYPHYELIIVDDGSTDNTEEVINAYCQRHEHIRYFKKINEERGAARNFGLKQAKGEYAVFFDSDDWMLPDCLETLHDIIEKQQRPFMAAAKYNYRNGGKTEDHPELKSLREGFYSRDFFLKGNILACNYCIRITGNQFRFFPEERSLASMEDWLFLLLNLEREKIYIRDKVCVTMRQHAERSMMNNKKVIEARKQAFDWIMQHVPLSREEIRTVERWSHYFYAIHYYLDYNRKDSVKETLSVFKLGGASTASFALLLKSLLGRKLIARFK